MDAARTRKRAEKRKAIRTNARIEFPWPPPGVDYMQEERRYQRACRMTWVEVMTENLQNRAMTAVEDWNGRTRLPPKYLIPAYMLTDPFYAMYRD